MDIRPIHNAEDHNDALNRISALMDMRPELGSHESDELQVLATLVQAYEALHHPIDPPTPIAAIQFRMDQMAMTRKDLEPMIGTRARVTEVLNAKRSLTLQMIRRLSQGLNISASVLIAEEPAFTARRSQQARRVTRRSTGAAPTACIRKAASKTRSRRRA